MASCPFLNSYKVSDYYPVYRWLLQDPSNPSSSHIYSDDPLSLLGSYLCRDSWSSANLDQYTYPREHLLQQLSDNLQSELSPPTSIEMSNSTQFQRNVTMAKSDHQATLQSQLEQRAPMPDIGYDDNCAGGPREDLVDGVSSTAAIFYGCTLYQSKKDKKNTLPADCSKTFANQAEARYVFFLKLRRHELTMMNYQNTC